MITLKSQKTKNRKRPGRGLSAGQGKTAGRGTKGQNSRAGHNIPNQFEGGQTALSMRLPKLPGFKSHRAKSEVLSLDIISANFKDGDTVSLASLIEKKLIIKGKKLVKILNNGKLTVKVSLSPEIKASKSVIESFTAIAPTPKAAHVKGTKTNNPVAKKTVRRAAKKAAKK